MQTKKLLVAAASSALLLNAFATTAFAGTNIQISGNLVNSANNANVSVVRTTNVVQNNTANVNNDVDIDAETGENDANDNIGGEVSIETGKADVGLLVKNQLNSNTARVDCCSALDTDILIEGNGANTNNTVDLEQVSTNSLFQDNDADVDNDVYIDAETGENDANQNGSGDVSIETGKADVDALVLTRANSNVALIGGDSEGSDLSLRILDNLTGSTNDINLGLVNTNLVTQDNEADVDNDVDVEAETGENDANDNIGGEVSIETGAADVDLELNNEVNFNWADINCGCLFEDLLVKVDGNGADTTNTIDATLVDSQIGFQDNEANLDNDLDEVEAETGENDANQNGGGSDADPSIETGGASVGVAVRNSANMNVLGGDSDIELPDFDVDFDFDFSALWAWFMISSM